jgi:hypothetical protein
LTSTLRLGGLPALAVAPFVAVAAYLAPVLLARGDDLGRVPAVAAPGRVLVPSAATHPAAPTATGLELLDAPPPGRPRV